ncbi:MAG: ABC transporter six-transmembrane domain-containing protein [Acidobacteria bacterium]|nr:ABC transporter six-transmembrane domain-containing protein [Acidobacteriota bacterium]
MLALLKRFAGRFALTLTLVVLEAAAWTLFPLALGRAIDAALGNTRRGFYELAGLGIAAMAIAIARRVVDSRAYARIYARLGEDLVLRESGGSTSALTARLGMLREIVEFFENSLPNLVNSTVGLGGTLLILSALNPAIALGCLGVGTVTAAIYALTGRLTTRYNRGLNDEHERQVDAVSSGDPQRVGSHLRELMRWNIRLSDLEAANFGVVWLFMVGLLVFSVSAAAEATIEYGSVFAVVMYVFQFGDSVILLPFFYQQWLRLREISGRITASGVAA